jgi:hypothetical protein
MLVLQSCTDSLRVLPGSSTETFPTSSDGTYDFGNIKVEEDYLGIKQEEVLEEVTFSDIKSEPEEVSYVCMYVCYETHFTIDQK